LRLAAGTLLFGLELYPASAAASSVDAPTPSTANAAADTNTIDGILGYFADAAAAARATQPTWSSPIATTTGLLEQRVRFDVDQERLGNGADTTALDGSKGADFIVSDSNEIQLTFAPYDIRTGGPGGKPQSGFGDWAFLRLEQRLASSPQDAGNYVLTAWLQIQAPTGIAAFTNGSWTLQPTLAFGKGWGDFDIQGTVAGVLPTTNVGVLGDQVQTNIALQYHVRRLFWPELEVNWTYYADGQRAGLNQVYITPGLTVGRFNLSESLKLTFGFGYQIAVAPDYRPKPLTPAYTNGWLLSSRINF
jgi:hypothetical protein